MKIRSKAVSALTSGVALLAFAGSGSAASLTYDGAVFTTTVAGSGTSYTLTMVMDFTNAYTLAGGDPKDNEFLGDMMEAWSLRLPGAATLSLLSAPAPNNWSLANSAQADASGCGSGNVNTICVDWKTLNILDGGGPLISTSSIFTFVVDVDFASATDFFGNGNFHLLSVAEKCSGPPTNQKCEIKKDGGLISLPLSGDDNDGDDNDVPEPGTLALLGLGLIGLGLGRRRI